MSETVDFKLPDVGEGVAQGQLIEWHVAEGETVEEDQVVAEVETDKAVVEIPSPVDGDIQSLLAEEGDSIPVGDVFVTFRTEGDDSKRPETETASSGDALEAPTDGDSASNDQTATEVMGTDQADVDRVIARPSVRRLAREMDISLQDLTASAPGRRITERDVQSAAGEIPNSAAPSSHNKQMPEEPSDDEARSAENAENTPKTPNTGNKSGSSLQPQRPHSAEPSSSASVQSSTGDQVNRDRTLAAPATRRRARERGIDINRVPADQRREGEPFVTPEALERYVDSNREPRSDETLESAAKQPDRMPHQDETRVPYTGIRRAIASQMERSKFTAPQVTHQDTVDATRLVETREQLKPKAEKRGVNLTYLPFVMKASVAALEKYPILNAELDEENDEIVQKHYYNFGVATDTETGLMVPVVEDVDQKSILEIAIEIDELVERARDRSITPEEMKGGTFTVTNIGRIGGEFGTPILNYPEVAILALGSLAERPRVVDGEVMPRYVLPISMTSDHRVVDGGDAARFTNELKQYIESPSRLLLK